MSIDGCADPDCVVCQWIVERIIKFNDDMKQAILASAPPPITVKLWLTGDPTPPNDERN